MLVFLSNKFSWTKINDRHRASADALTLGFKPGEISSQFYIKSVKTGKKKKFLFPEHLYENEDYLGTKYFVPGDNVNCIIFND